MTLIRATFWAAAGYTAIGAYIFAMPNSVLGNLFQMPDQVPPLYTALTAYMLFLFSAMYGWLALQPTVIRPILYLGMLGKCGGFAVGVVLWLTGAIDLATVIMLSGDGLFATFWLVWLLRS
jgi:hypothetical protein